MKIKNTVIFVLLLAVSCLMITCKKKDSGSGSGSGTTVTGADYAGSWTVTSACGNYPMTITASGDNLTMTKFHSDFTVTATISGNSLTIPSQSRTGSSGNGPYVFQGSGTKNGNSLSITYTVKDGGATTNCSATATK
jgi:hypothetical protein